MTTVVVLTWIVAILSVIGGVLALVLGSDDLAVADLDESTVTIYGWTEIVVGVLIALVAVGLSRGSGFARVLISALMAVRVGMGVWAIVQLPNGAITGSATIAVAVLILFLLWNSKASAFFRTN